MDMLHLLKKLKEEAKENMGVLVQQLEGAKKLECARLGSFKSQRRTDFA